MPLQRAMISSRDGQWMIMEEVRTASAQAMSTSSSGVTLTSTTFRSQLSGSIPAIVSSPNGG